MHLFYLPPPCLNTLARDVQNRPPHDAIYSPQRQKSVINRVAYMRMTAVESSEAVGTAVFYSFLPRNSNSLNLPPFLCEPRKVEASVDCCSSQTLSFILVKPVRARVCVCFGCLLADPLQRGGRARDRERRAHERHPPAAGAQVRRAVRPLPQLSSPGVQ